jgi:nitroreductase
MNETNAIKSRRSTRTYSRRQVPHDVIDDVLDCARLSPTARNIQPWFFVAVTEKETLSAIGYIADHGRFIADCSVCFAVFCRKDEKYYLEDGCATTMNIIHALNLHGVGSCWVAGDKKPYCADVSKLLYVGDEYTLVSLISAGYPAGPQNEPAKKSISEVSRKK